MIYFKGPFLFAFFNSPSFSTLVIETGKGMNEF